MGTLRLVGEVVRSCRDCDTPIYEGETYWCVEVHQEVQRGCAVSVLHAEDHGWVFCEKCAKRRDFSTIEIARFASP